MRKLKIFNRLILDFIIIITLLQRDYIVQVIKDEKAIFELFDKDFISDQIGIATH